MSTIEQSTNFSIKTSSFQDVQVKEEIFMYDGQDLIADFGGIMGLLLGASILSFYDFIENVLRKLIDFCQFSKLTLQILMNHSIIDFALRIFNLNDHCLIFIVFFQFP